jgi:predicted  nucleic acid-binding Zn-ribbon protein
MTTPKSAEEIRKLELSLEEIVAKFSSRIQLIREDLRSLISDIESLKNHIAERRRQSNDYTREVSDLTNDLQTFRSEIEQIEREISTFQNQNDSINAQVSDFQSNISAARSDLGIQNNDKSSLITTLRSLDVELAALQNVHDELQPKFESRMLAITKEYEKLKTERDLLAHRFKAVRLLCARDYIQSPEIGLIRFLAKKPSPDSTTTEIRSALGMDPGTINRVLNQLAERQVLDFNEASESVKLLLKIDLFDKEVF